MKKSILYFLGAFLVLSGQAYGGPAHPVKSVCPQTVLAVPAPYCAPLVVPEPLCQPPVAPEILCVWPVAPEHACVIYRPMPPECGPRAKGGNAVKGPQTSQRSRPGVR